jgi:hypothetical protein
MHRLWRHVETIWGHIYPRTGDNRALPVTCVGCPKVRLVTGLASGTELDDTDQNEPLRTFLSIAVRVAWPTGFGEGGGGYHIL